MRRTFLFTCAALAALALTAGPAWAPPAAYQDEQLFSTGDAWEPVAAADPSEPYVYLVSRDLHFQACAGCPAETLMLRVSNDGGETFSPARPLCAEGCAQSSVGQADPSLAVAADGTVLAAWLDGNSPGPVVSRSTDHGATWSRPVAVAPSGNGWTDKPWLTASRSGADVYVGYYGGTRAWIASSHDGGRTFTAVKVADDARYWFPEGGTVTPDGTAYVTMSAEDTSGLGPVQLAVFRSTNGGASWTKQVVAGSEQGPACVAYPGCIADFFQAQITIASDAAGKLMLAYSVASAAGGPKALFVRTSADGLTWSAPVLVSDAGDSGFQQVVAGPGTNDFRIAWQDDRAGAFNTWLTRTGNGGRSWSSHVRLSNLGSGASYKTSAGYTFPYGDYMGLAVTSQGANVAVWGEGTGRKSGGNSWFTRGG